MKRNVLQHVIGFLFKYIWLFCTLLIVLEVASTMYTAQLLLRETTQGMLQSVSGEISARVNATLQLIDGMANDKQITDTTQPQYDRAMLTVPYRDSYGLYMIAITDEDVNVVSSNETNPNPEKFSLAHRDYMQKLYATGETQITDAFPAGADSVTMNYTIAVPILTDGKVTGSIFGSIYFDEIAALLERSRTNGDRRYYLLGEQATFMVGGSDHIYGQTLPEAVRESIYMGKTSTEVDADIRAGVAGNCWEWGSNGLCYISYQRVAPTQWTIASQVKFTSAVRSLIPAVLVKVGFYIAICWVIAVFGKRYLNRHLAAVNHLLDKVTVMQKELFQTEQPDYDNLLELTEKGLSDQLTGLSTRAMFFNRVMKYVMTGDAHGALFFVDLDDLKRINDTFGHEAGDAALLHFAQVLKRCEQEVGGIAARYGGDEFILVIENVDEKTATDLAERLCNDFRVTLTVQEHTLTIHGSIGVAVFPEHGQSPEELISKADLALYSAKQDGKNRYALYGADAHI